MNSDNEPRDYYTDVPFVIDAAPLKEKQLVLALGLALHQLTTGTTTAQRGTESWEEAARREGLRFPLSRLETV